ncbi:MAG: 4Fe-4S binding protein [Phycisphaerae bacterium]|nr:4Fe-4S binding protein [Phycisphaerae bacterium]
MRHNGLVTTIGERCRVCYTCVRECPAKAIRIAVGQAEVIPERCIGCGNCVRVCSQNAKQVISSVEQVRELLQGDAPVTAIIAPSFPAEFSDVPWPRLVGMIRALGFDSVVEVAVGADLVADRYRKLLANSNGHRYIATTCPGIVAYVERYQPDLLPHLAPIVSPMVAVARVLRSLHKGDLRIVFLGPCIAKKGEVTAPAVPDEVDEALTFAELRDMFTEAKLTPDSVEDGDFDPPVAAEGALFSIRRGLLQAADIREDLIAGNVVTAEGRDEFLDALEEFRAGDLNSELLEVLCCKGCIMGAGMTSRDPLYSRRSHVSRYVRERTSRLDRDAWAAQMNSFETLDLSRRFTKQDQRIPVPYEEEIQGILRRMGKFSHEDELNCGACGYETCRDHATAILKGLAESEMCLPYTIETLKKTVKELNLSHEQLASTQAALMQSEKLASMGQLAAGIAHEVNNPLGIVLVYAHLLLDEYKNQPKMRDDLEMIARHADRCKKIVSGLLHFSRQNKVIYQETDVRHLIEQTLKVIPQPADVRVDARHDLADPHAELDGDQITQVLTNLISNAYAAMPNGGTLTVTTTGTADDVTIAITDTGVGIPEENREKIFEPFFTTKQIGKGTGLGLAVTYGIVKMHSGDIRVESNADAAKGPTGTTFTVTLPRRSKT